MDVVIYDKSLGTVFNTVKGERCFPCETVIAVGEVKTNVDSNTTLTDALEMVRSVKRLDRSNKGKNNAFIGPGSAQGWIKFDPQTNYRDQIFGFVFTSSSMQRDTLVSGIQKFNASNPIQHWMNLFCAFNRFVIHTKLLMGSARILWKQPACTAPKIPTYLTCYCSSIAS